MPRPADSPSLSKTRFLAGVQCHKRLWWEVHEPEASELAPDAALRNLFAQGAEVGRLARRYVPGGELIEAPYHGVDGRIAATRAALERGAPVIYEGLFAADGAYAAVDILERRGDGFALIEVKAATSVKEDHIPDVAVQVWILRRGGVPVERAEVMHLNRECRYPELGNLFVREDVTAQVEELLPSVPRELEGQRRMLGGPLPRVPIGEHCTRPRDCPFLKRCWPEWPADHVGQLYRVSRWKALEYEADGFASIHDLPSDFELSTIHARQIKALTRDAIVVEPTLREALAAFRPPLAFLDFETVSKAIPVWDGCRPWEDVPVQFSCHAHRGRGPLAHYEFLADGPEDPRPAVAERLVEACRGARAVVVYYANFERAGLRHLAAAVPPLAAELHQIEERLVDLLPVVRNHVYHPDFGGSFGLKSVLPALVPSLAYSDLTIQDGETASVELMRLLFGGDEVARDERATLREALLRYCERDTLAMVKLLERLRGLMAEQLELF